jgi:hypothetical protein
LITESAWKKTNLELGERNLHCRSDYATSNAALTNSKYTYDLDICICNLWTKIQKNWLPIGAHLKL